MLFPKLAPDGMQMWYYDSLLPPERSVGGNSLGYTEDDKVKRIPKNVAGAARLRKPTGPLGLCSHEPVKFLTI